MLKEESQEIMNKRDMEADLHMRKELTGHIENLWRQEEMYWRLRSRIRWLQWGDTNTNFFHATIIQRRQRNIISMLKNTEDSWMRDIGALKQMTVDFFEELYKSMGP